MSKYQRIHNFLLRLARVETVLGSMYMDTTHQASRFITPIKSGVDMPRRANEETARFKMLFRYDPMTKQSIHLLRFKMTNFIFVLSRYVLDVAIEKNWSVMHRRLSRLRVSHLEDQVSSDTSSDQTVETERMELSFGSIAHETESEMHSPASPIKLRSVNSLVMYHHVIMDRTLRSLLLLPTSPSQQTTLAILMKMFTAILNLGKVLKEVELGIIDEEDAVAHVLEAKQLWEEQDTTFVSFKSPFDLDHAHSGRCTRCRGFR